MGHALILAASVLSGTGAVPPVDFARDIRPILLEHCARCHAAGRARGGFALDSRAAILAHEGAVVPGSAERSRLVALVRGDDPELRMPLEGEPLPPAQVELLARWIDEGAAWPADETLHGSGGQPILPRRPPLTGDAHRNPIDRILERYWAERGVTPEPLIDDAAFVRRAWLDLTGLLPPPDDLERFLADARPDKRAALVKELLSDDTAWAEHWLSFWNDLLRNDYAGPGYIDGGRTQITPWLYAALRDRLPYDRFASALINPIAETRGFADGITWRGERSASQGREIQFARNVAQVFLGVNLKCASCHDSFVDHWRLADAYGMAAVMAEEPLQLFRCDQPTGEWAAPAFLFPEVGAIDPALPPARRLEQLAALVTSPRNGRFTRTIANRIWERMMGRGLIDPPDSMDGEPWCRDLLDHLAVELSDRGHDLRALVGLIARSDAYQRRTAAAAERAPFVFRGPGPRRLSAEQFVDAVWSLTGGAPAASDAPLPAPARQGRWVWGHADAARARPAGERILLRGRFDLERAPRRVVAVITADNAYELAVNGRTLAADADWPTVETIDISGALRAGPNEVVITAANLGHGPNPAGLYFEAALEPEAQRVVASGPDWEWRQAGSDEPWRTVAVLEPFLGHDLERRIDGALGVARRGAPLRAALVSADPLMRTLGRPDREQVVSQRPRDLTTLAALHLSNGADVATLLRQGAQGWAARGLAPQDLVRELYLRLLARPPSGAERAIALELLESQPGPPGIEDLMWILLMLPEFQLVT